MDTKRAKLIADLFGDSKGFLSKGKILKFDKKLRSIKTENLIDFSIFADKFRSDFLNSDLIIHKALIAWHKKIFLNIKKPGIKYFKNIDEMIEFLKEGFKEEFVCSGAKDNGFLPFAKIFMDDKGELRNSCVVIENGTFQRLNGEESYKVYNYLFTNQEKIGYIENITRQEYERLHKSKQIQNNYQTIDNKIKTIALNALKGLPTAP